MFADKAEAYPKSGTLEKGAMGATTLSVMTLVLTVMNTVIFDR
jgi:hypothetical protein